ERKRTLRIDIDGRHLCVRHFQKRLSGTNAETLSNLTEGRGLDRFRLHCLVRTTRPVKVACWQSVPVKSASMRVASAVPTLPNVPRQPRGELNSPCVLIPVGGLFAGESAVK